MPDVSGAVGGLCDGRGRGEVDHGQVSLHALGDVADLMFGPEGAGRTDGGQPPQVRRVQGLAAQLGDLIGGGHGAEHGKGRPAAGVGGEANPQRPGEGHVEEARADEGVGGWAMDDAGPGLGQAVLFALGQVDGVAEDGTFAQKALSLVGVKVIAGLRVERADPGHFVDLFGKVGLHQAIGVFGPQGAEGVQLVRRRGRREARGDDIGQPVLAMPALQQALAVVIGRAGGIAQGRGRIAVHAGLAGKGAQAAQAGGGEKGIDRGRVGGGVAAHRGGAMGQRKAEVTFGHVGGIGGVAKAHFLGEGVVVQPVDQPLAP